MADFATGSSLTIEETASAGAGFQPRKITLLGPALPFMGAEWGFENNVQTTWYPGNAIEATQQNLGPREMPSNWEGEWKRTLMGRLPTRYVDESGQEHKIVSPHVLREVFEDVARAARQGRPQLRIQGYGLGFEPQIAQSHRRKCSLIINSSSQVAGVQDWQAVLVPAKYFPKSRNKVRFSILAQPLDLVLIPVRAEPEQMRDTRKKPAERVGKTKRLDKAEFVTFSEIKRSRTHVAALIQSEYQGSFE